MKMQNVFERRKIQFLTNLNVVFEKNTFHNLVLLEAEGYSNDEQIGIPSFVCLTPISELTEDGILEFDLIIEPLDHEKRETLNWSTRIVFDLKKYPNNLKGIKVNAEKNSDIVLIN